MNPSVAGAPVAGAAPGSDWRAIRHAERDARRAAWRQSRAQRRSGLGPLLFGLILIFVGAYYLVRAWIPAIDVDRTWPILLVAIGVILLFSSVRRSPDSSG